MKKEVLVPVIVVLLSIAFLDPFMILMPLSLVYVLTALLCISGLLYALLVWHETSVDEREYVHRAFAGRIAYLSGVIVLVGGIIYQILVPHQVDSTLVLALSIMTIAKYVGLRYVQSND